MTEVDQRNNSSHACDWNVVQVGSDSRNLPPAFSTPRRQKMSARMAEASCQRDGFHSFDTQNRTLVIFVFSTCDQLMHGLEAGDAGNTQYLLIVNIRCVPWFLKSDAGTAESP